MVYLWKGTERKDSNEEIRLKIVVTLIDERMRESGGEQLMGRKSS